MHPCPQGPASKIFTHALLIPLHKTSVGPAGVVVLYLLKELRDGGAFRAYIEGVIEVGTKLAEVLRPCAGPAPPPLCRGPCAASVGLDVLTEDRDLPSVGRIFRSRLAMAGPTWVPD